MSEGTAYCSFCGKSQHDVLQLIAGPNDVFICDGCVVMCVECAFNFKPILKLPNREGWPSPAQATPPDTGSLSPEATSGGTHSNRDGFPNPAAAIPATAVLPDSAMVAGSSSTNTCSPSFRGSGGDPGTLSSNAGGAKMDDVPTSPEQAAQAGICSTEFERAANSLKSVGGP